jgi:MoaA/NifB/PqqE/SkfB family radical SAM enzyme
MNERLRLQGIIKNKALLGPQFLDILITSKCNLSCLFCTIHSRYNPVKIKTKNLPFPLVKGIIDDAYKLKVENITISGDGESALHPDICEIIDYIKRKGFFLNINTNLAFSGTNILKSFLKADRLSVNLSAYNEETYSEIYQANFSTFSHLINNLQIVSHSYKKRGKPLIAIIYVLNKLNYQHILEFIKFLKSFHISFIEFTPMEERPFIKKLTLSDREIQSFHNLIKEISKSGVNFYCNLNDKKEIAIYKCYIPFLYSRVEVDGTVAFCCKNENLIIGNVHKNDFFHIWSSKEAEDIRKSAIYNFDISSKKWKVCQSCDKYLRAKNKLIEKQIKFLKK